ncbi:exonuclease SbcCD subunit D [Halalkalibacterium halodurans]|uniref:BH2382 protein n=1 Tax=Halalkalibacterium halodurans (strain ATCC BAA-125 / DSM 18197 / FERM 7344 / JCM 9153 / C-125) TaxID=272558 RepID=Q9KAA8_HALH5|nr:exonuclease SbcCD subunit D [Halalkalibacterium halodurans]MED4080047.1 exonuclease SbcCD subunit D [Halalkalibacterium halodurans]MED4086814.1 exonuclease SbcCD subunit D [Halalkalibacterium halodurans]MED4104274.1 exonuclease SbcCD subunit D [Halalkalibacterium halodurans]MED4110368.1 exonuclease SbcCD subunit D [Halalkalibacterium halodurans]MED4150451.1 exonuclease SbcCD subunit D [Halalkalibacterium halodurans]
MIKFLYFTDTHIRGTAPKNRLDPFVETLKHKLHEVMEIAETEKVDMLLHGGDVFDRPDLSPNVVGQFAQIFRKTSRPIYAIAGNHDTFGHNPETISRTMLGLLHSFGIIHIIDPQTPVLVEKDGVKVQISGQPYHYDIDQRDPKLDYYPVNVHEADVMVHLVHSMLVEKALPEGIPHTLIDHIWGTSADVLLTGHFHGGFGIKQKDGRYICNPGAIARINNHWTELVRTPTVILGTITKDGIDLKERPLQSAKNGEEVLDRSFLEKSINQEEKLHAFIQQVKEHAEFQSLNMNDVINEIAAMSNVEEPVKQEALRRITVIEEAWKGGEHEYD